MTGTGKSDVAHYEIELKSIERKLLALEIDAGGESTDNDFLATCSRYDALDIRRKNVAAAIVWILKKGN